MNLYAADFSSKETLPASFDAWPNPDTVRPTLAQDVDLINGVARCWNEPGINAGVGNERFITWRAVGKNRGFWNKTALSLEYDLCIGTDFAMTADGCKIPGLSGLYQSYDGGFRMMAGEYLPSSFASWENRLWHGPLTPRGIQLGNYLYCTRNPTIWANKTDGAGFPIPGTMTQQAGVTASPGKVYNQGNQQHGGWDEIAQKPTGLMTSGFLQLGQTHRIRHDVRLNTVKDQTLRISDYSGDDALARAIANGNPDGLLRIWLDDKIVGEWPDVTFRGDASVCFFEAWINIYQGGTQRFVSARSHYDLSRITVSDLDGPIQPQGDTMPTVTLTVPTGTVINTVETVDGKPPAGDTAALTAMTANRDQWKAYADQLRAKAQAMKDADAAKVDGQDSLDVPQPPVV